MICCTRSDEEKLPDDPEEMDEPVKEDCSEDELLDDELDEEELEDVRIETAF